MRTATIPIRADERVDLRFCLAHMANGVFTPVTRHIHVWAQRKARTKASPTELSSSDLSCSICNRQFRAKIGLISHLRIHK